MILSNTDYADYLRQKVKVIRHKATVVEERQKVARSLKLEAFRSPSGLSEAKAVSRGAEGGDRRDLRDRREGEMRDEW
jgi:hypothetical protein